MIQKQKHLLGRVMCAAVALAFVAGTANAAVYGGVLKFGFGDGGTGLDVIGTMGTLEPVDTANNGISPCAAPGALVDNNGFGTAPTIGPSPVSSNVGTGPQTATHNFVGLGDLTTAGAGTKAQMNPVTADVAGTWGLVANCPIYINAVPGGSLFRRTQMATFSFPMAPVGFTLTNPPYVGTFAASGGPGATAATTPAAFSRPGQSLAAAQAPGGNGYGGSVLLLGAGDTYLGLNGGPLGLGAGNLPVPIAVGTRDRVNGAAGTPTGTTTTMSILFHLATGPSAASAQIGGPLVPTSNPPFAFQAFADGAGFAWTTGTVTAYDGIGNFKTTRVRSGGKSFGPGAGDASIQVVSAAVLSLGVGPVPLGIAVTGELDLTFVPEPASIAMLGAGVGVLGVLFMRRRRSI